MRVVRVRCRHLNGRQLSGLNNILTAGWVWVLWGACAWDKNTLARLCAKKAGGAYARGGAYLRDTTVLLFTQGHRKNDPITKKWGKYSESTTHLSISGKGYKDKDAIFPFKFTNRLVLFCMPSVLLSYSAIVCSLFCLCVVWSLYIVCCWTCMPE